jgi:hypothetical protein
LAFTGRHVGRLDFAKARKRPGVPFGIGAVAEDANPRITQINNDVAEALDEARKAAGERNAAVNAFRSPSVQASNSDMSQMNGLPVAFQPSQSVPGMESVTVSGERMPRSADMPTGTGDPGAISCRMPQQLANSRLMGPEICKHNRDWAKLYKDGRNLSADGTKIVESEKGRTFNPLNCIATIRDESSGLVSQMSVGCISGQ